MAAGPVRGYSGLSPQIATQRPSTTLETQYPFMGLVPQLKEWVTERKNVSVTSYSYTIQNKDYELSIQVERNKILDDQYGLYAPMVEEIGRSAKKWPDIQIASLMQRGVTELCYDNQHFFDTQHPIDMLTPTAGVQSNYYTTTPLNVDNYAKVRANMMSLVGENGLPLGVIPGLLVVPPQLEPQARAILHADYVLSQGTTLPVTGGTNILRVPRIFWSSQSCASNQRFGISSILRA